MQANRDERVTSEERSRHSTQTLLTAVAVLILAGGAYLLAPDRSSDDPDASAMEADTPAPTQTITPPKPTPAVAISDAPDIPEPAADSQAEPAATAAPAPPPPTPEEVDRQLRAALDEQGVEPPASLTGMLDAPYVLDRGVSSLDQLARGLVPRRALNLPRPAGSFATRRDGESYFVDPAGYQRYADLVSGITSLEVEKSAELFQQFRPLLRQAYAALGYPADMMDNTLIAALDAIVAAPVRDTPPTLTSKGALWAYEDEQLEGASDLHKQLLRTGPDNTRALQAWAARLKRALLNP